MTPLTGGGNIWRRGNKPELDIYIMIIYSNFRMEIKKLLICLTLIALILPLSLIFVSKVHAGWVSGYFRSDGSYVGGYYRTEPNYYKWDNYSFDNDWSDIYNDNSWYRGYGYDPEPWDDDYVSSYSQNYYYDNSYDYDDYDYSWSSSSWDW